MMREQKLILKALSGQKTQKIPFWFMRQAGRYLPEYRELRAQKGGFLAMALDPKAAAEITVQPIRRFGMDAAIIFSDILTIPYGLGQHLEFVQGEGPKLDSVRCADDFSRLSFDRFDEILAPVYEALKETRSQLVHEGFADTTLIGFAGAPWTVITYMIEGGSSRDFLETKKIMFGQPDLFAKIVDLVVDATARYLIKQIDAGAEVIKIFDSWASALDPDSFARWVIEPAKDIVARVKAVHPDIPVIGFPRGAGQNYIPYADQTGIDALAIDTQVPTGWARDVLQMKLPVQGNLDPLCLLAGGTALDDQVKRILDDLSGGPFIFNLGHGINKETPIAHVEQMVKLIRNLS